MCRSVELVFIVDESGSMFGLKSDTIGGLNSVLEEHRKGGGEVFVTLVTFADESHVRLEHEPIADVKNLTDEDYVPGGCTALLDAVGDTVKSIRKAQKSMPKSKRPDTIVVIITDGAENASRKYDNKMISKLVKKRKSKGWEFLFLGANIDAFSAANRIGIDSSRASRYVSDAAGTAVAYETVSAAVASYRSDGAVLDSWAKATEADAEARAQ